MLRRFSIVPLVLASALAQGEAGPQEPAVGKKIADSTFPTFLNGDGRQSLSEFFGQPIVIDQWGIH